jgi:hypothetical protein
LRFLGIIARDGILGHQFNNRLESFASCPFYWRILKKTILYSGFNNPFKKIRETRNKNGKKRVENQTKT